MKSNKTIFLEKAVLGRNTNFGESEEVIKACINIAYRDMLTAGRFYLSNEMKERCTEFKKILKERNYCYDNELIEVTLGIFGDEEEIRKGKSFATRYGLAQKLVNMTYKYFWIFSEYIDKKIDFSHCDCPLDSIILSKLENKNHAWSKIKKEDYEEAQNDIAERLKQSDLTEELKKLGNLAFDFLIW